MNKQPEALRLAELLEQAAGDYTAWDKKTGYAAAAELRRLHALNAELLETLREIGEYRGEGPYTTPWQDIVCRLGELARAAIAKAEWKQ